LLTLIGKRERAVGFSGDSGREALRELSEQITQLQKEQSTEVFAALHDVQSRLSRRRAAAANADNALNATHSRYSGKIVDLSFF
jgi:hypothetical protein